MSTHTPTNILHIRDRLNKLPFRNGTRRVLIGRISKRFEPIEPFEGNEGDDDREAQLAAIEQYLEELRGELVSHDLELARGDRDRMKSMLCSSCGVERKLTYPGWPKRSAGRHALWPWHC